MFKKNPEEYPVYYKRKPAPVRMHMLTASVVTNLFLIGAITLYTLGYLHTSRTFAMIQPTVDTRDYLTQLEAASTCYFKKEIAVKIVILISSFVDSILTWWIFASGFIQLSHQQYFEASFLIVAGVFWQRAWKIETIAKAKQYIRKKP